jgi:PAS domain S-box-containing protein
LRLASVCIFYYVAVVLAVKLRLGFSHIAILWPSNAILVAVILLTPARRWWVYLLAVIPIHVVAQDFRTLGPGWLAYQILLNSTLATVVASLIRGFASAAACFSRLRETFAFLTIVTIVPWFVTATAAGIVTVSLPNEALIRHGWTGGWWNTVRQASLCNIVSLLGIVPAIVLWADRGLKPIRALRGRRRWELLVIALLLIFTSGILFTRHETPLYLQSALFLVPMLFLLWAGVRFGSPGAATALLALVCISAWGAYRSQGPFTGTSSADRAVSVQIFWILLAWPGMSLAAAIEERRQAEETLTRGQQRYELATAAGHVAVWSYNYRTREVVVDRALSALLGYPADNARSGEDWLQRIHPDDLEAILVREEAILSPEAPRNASGETPIPQIQYRLRCADGSFRWVNSSGTLYREGDAPALAVGTTTDITELKKVQEASLAHQKLESLGVLAGGIAHDFNNLLGSIHIQAELAEMNREDGVSPEEEIQTIKTISIRASEIVRQLMIYAGHEKSDSEPLDLSRLVVEMLPLLKISISKSAVLKTDLAGGLPAVLGNEPQIRQVLMNLVLNASDALGDNPGVIRIATASGVGGVKGFQVPTNVLPGGKHVMLSVSDTGAGIGRDVQARIFDPFFTTKFAGRGLGLAVVQGVVRAHGGTIHLDSTPGQGATFHILWPIARPLMAAPSAATGATSAAPGRTAGTILIVEDETVLRLSLSKMLRKEGFAVIEAEDGTTAVELVRSHHDEIDVVLLDMTIPGAASRTVVAEAARIRPGIKVLLTSAYNQEMAWPSADANVCGFIRKPFRLQDLIGMIQETLSACG